jgi:hypothetical protein
MAEGRGGLGFDASPLDRLDWERGAHPLSDVGGQAGTVGIQTQPASNRAYVNAFCALFDSRGRA